MSHRQTVIDLRSDTVTRPTPGMRAAMATADVGDDVFGEDPTVRRLEERVAELLGKEAALFVPSGTMSNQICIKAHTQPGDELICDVNSHIYNYEAGGPAVLSGVMCRTIEGDCGVFDVADLEGLIRPENDHLVRTRLVCLENTHNRGGGKIFPLEKIRAIASWAHRHGLLVHLDGARLWNASIATGVPLRDWAEHCDSVSVCFSKGLGAPVGSALAGTKDFVKRARKIRKLFGGGMRQAGVLAAAALYALEHHFHRLAEDHHHAQMLAQAVRNSPHLLLHPSVIETNILYADVEPGWSTAPDFARALAQHGVLVLPVSPQRFRMVTHLDVSHAQVEQAAEILEQTARTLALRAA
ncbi:L-allo-threonine aldolase [bacterium HR36]|nr:L-allo-threonine aldolase [bacterium HR36]